MNAKYSRLIEVKWQILKNAVKRNEMSIEEIDKVTRELLDILAELTVNGVTHIMDTSVDTY